MKKPKCIIAPVILAILACTLFSLSCKKGTTCLYREKGTVKSSICGFVIELDNGEIIQPLSGSELDIQLYEGQNVKLAYKVDLYALSLCSTGKGARIKCIKEI
ncbi:MAG: hypothetical protein JKX73_00925 [Flavobacteriales bacterium]|nr:hypothetical protein [Flavobacteriales bacterium]